MLPNSYILITGASSGLGRASAERLSQHYYLILHGRDAERLHETRLACRNPEKHILWQADLLDVDQIEPSLTHLLSENHIAVCGYVHAAGAVSVFPARMLKPERIRSAMNLNFCSAAELSRVLLMKKHNAEYLRCMVFITSIACRRGVSGYSGYSAAKGALLAYMRSLAVELAPTVKVNAVSPGPVNTAGTKHFFADPKYLEQHREDCLLGSGTADDVAAAVEFLVGDNSRWITGQELVVDGGCTAH